jgi:hypothetical protein
MPPKDFPIPLDDEGLNSLRVYIETDGGQVTRFTVQYETLLDGRITPVMRCDTAHGFAHCDILGRDGATLRKRDIKANSFNEALQLGMRDLRDNWRMYLERFLKGEQ